MYESVSRKLRRGLRYLHKCHYWLLVCLSVLSVNVVCQFDETRVLPVLLVIEVANTNEMGLTSMSFYYQSDSYHHPGWLTILVASSMFLVRSSEPLWPAFVQWHSRYSPYLIILIG